jgi:cytochrome P450
VTRPFLDFTDPAFSTRSAAVRAARDTHWCAETPYGLAVLRWREVGLLLRDRRLRQGSHAWPAKTGLSGSFADFWSRSVIGREEAHHQRLRNLIAPVLTEDYVADFIPVFDRIAADLCDRLRQISRAEFMSAFSIPFAGRAIVHLLGMPDDEWDWVSHDASTLGLAMGVECKHHQGAVNAAYERLSSLGERLVANVRAGHDADSFVAHMVARFDAADDCTAEELNDIIVIAIFGGVDTTRSQLGLGLSQFIEHPDQWAAFRADEGLAEQVVAETIRARPTTTWATREAVETFEFGGEVITAGTTLHMLVHASARHGDPAPDFDICAKRRKHFGFGGGAHHCIGHLVARTDMACAWRALRRTLQTIDYDGPARWLPDSGNTSAEHLPVRYTIG